MKKQERAFIGLSIGAALILTAIVYAPMFKGKIPFPADFIYDFPPFAPFAPSEGLLPHTNIGDLVTSFYPYRALAARVVREGTIPLWNPYMLSGAPFLAMAQSALFYPANFLYYVLPVSLAWSLGFVIRRALAAFFTALFVRRIGGSTAGSIAAGLMFSFCGFLTAWQGQTMSDAAIWLPLICYSVVRMHGDPRARSIAIAAFAFAMPVLAGHPETAAHLTLTGLALAAFMLIREPRGSFVKSFVAAGLLAVGLAAVQILPTLEWLRYIHHSLKDPWPPPPLRSMLALVSRDIIRAKTVIGLAMPEHAAYIAMMAFTAAPLAFLRKRSRGYAAFFVLLAATAISVAYGTGPAHWIVQHIPVLKMLKNARLTLVAAFAMAVLGGLGISAVEEIEAPLPFRRLLRAGILGAVGFGAAAVLIYIVHAIPVGQIIEFARVPRFGLMLLFAGAFAIGLKLVNRLPSRAFAVLAVAIVAVDVGTLSYGAIPFTRVRDVFPRIALFGVLPKDSIIPPRIAQMGHAYGANFELMYGFRSVGGYEISLERLKKFLSDLSPDEMDLIMFTTKGVLETRDRRIDMLSAKYYIVSEWDPRYLEFRKQPERFRFLHTFTDTDVYENLRALPPAWLVPASGIEAIADEERQLSRLKDPNFDAEHCVVMAEAPKDLPASPAAAAGVAGAAKVEWTRWSVNAFEVDVNAPEPSVLVISQTEYPGWKAWIDGKPAALTRANYVFPAIFVPPGSHHVRFSFEPSSFKAGLALSLLATAILGVMVFRSGSDRSNPNRV